MKKAFNLSEILITLGIIGVVSALTLPTVIKNYQKYTTVNQLKKVYTVLNQAFKMSEIDNDIYENWDKVEAIGIVEYSQKYWQHYLKVIKICSNYTDCGYSEALPWMNAINSVKTQKSIGEKSFIINDGTLITFNTAGDAIHIDLNAGAGPNRYGRDLFTFYIYNKGVIAAGSHSNPNDYCNKTRTEGNNGEWCSGKIVKDGWKIKDDYPW
ncbi:type II secretion system protein [bacterium]|nr:type II secretion system protein [bacterium]